MSERKAQHRARRLLLCLDGVPYELMRAARERGMFDRFHAPSRLLSPFPTLTNVALSLMLDASVPNGYESLYFDRAARELRGGIRKYIGRRTPDKTPSSYMDELDYQEPLHFEYLIYVAPEAVWRADMRGFRDAFRRAPATRDFFAFLKGTDGLLHIRGAESLNVALRSLDAILREIQDHCGAETEIVVFSDHGMNLEENRRVHLQTHLRRSGYELSDRFNKKSGRAVAVPAFGLCGYAAIYCGAEREASELSFALADLEGVDFTIFRDGATSIGIAGARGAARIHRAENGCGARYRYEQINGGDPLLLNEMARNLKESGEMDARGYASDKAWYALTKEHDYPDALANLYQSLHGERVRHTADALVSLRDGYYYGASVFSRFVRLAATHGNALKASSSAFLMSTHREFAPTVRASEANKLLRQ